jgi:hypothetical protein
MQGKICREDEKNEKTGVAISPTSGSFLFRLRCGHHSQFDVVVGSTMEFLDLLVCK